MRIKYVSYGTVRVSARWAKILKAANKAGVRFHVTSGHRSAVEQGRLFRQNMRLVGGRWVPKPGRPLTAKPYPTAPHIRTGRHAHALDVNALDGGEARLQRWLERKGARVTNPVPGEAWHLEVSGSDLKKLAAKIDPPPQRMSAKGIDFLIREEGLVPYAYNDPAGHATFGVGHLLHRGPVTAKDRLLWGTKTKPRPRKVATALFKRDLKKYEAAVREAVGRPLAQHQFDAFVSLCFNIGRDGFRASTAARMSRERRPQQAADAILMWDRPAVLKARRERERRLFLHGHG